MIIRVIVAAATVVSLVALLVRFDAFGPGDEPPSPAPIDSGQVDLTKLDRSKFTDAAPVAQAIRIFEGRVEDNPSSFIDYTLLGQLLIRQSRENADPDALNRAEAALTRALTINPGYTPAQAQYATALLHQHRFSEAIEVAESALQESDTNIQAVATLADARFAIGDYDGAREGYLRLTSIAAGPIAQTRVAQLEYLRGDIDESLRLMRSATVGEYETGVSAPGIAWYLARIGDLYLGIGNRADAAVYYEASLDLFERHQASLAGMARVRAADGKLEEAVSLYRRAVEISPDPTMVAELGDVYSAMGRANEAQIQYDTVIAIGRLNAARGSVAGRAMAMFYADHDREPTEALRLAEEEISLRHDVSAWDLLSWALYRNGRYAEAASASEKALAHGTREAAFHFHAALIQEALGDPDAASSHWAAVARINPKFSVLHAGRVQMALAALPAR